MRELFPVKHPEPPTGVEIISHARREEWLMTRTKFLGASEFPTLVTTTGYSTPFGLWALKSGRIEAPPDNPSLRKGRMLESAAVRVIALDHGVEIHQPLPFTIWADRESGLSCTPDSFITEESRSGMGVLQVKVVGASVFRRKWFDDLGEVRPPPHVMAQALIEQMLTGAQWCMVGVLELSEWKVDSHLIEVDAPPGFAANARRIAREFHDMIANGIQPDLNYGRDLELIKEIHREASEPPADLSGDVELHEAVISFARRRETINAALKDKDYFETIIRNRLGNHEAAKVGDFYVTAKVQKRKAYAVKESTSRPLRIKSMGDEE
jgi:hypothetical protein